MPPFLYHYRHLSTMAAMTHSFLSRLSQGPILADGAMGTELHRRGQLPLDTCFEHLNLKDPGLVRGVHLDYIEAGAELIETNTYGANAVRLDRHGLAGAVTELNRRGVEIAQEARQLTGQHVWIAGAMGPLGKALAPTGPVSRAQAQAAFRDQARALAEAGADLLVLETFPSLAEVQEAIVAVREVVDVPIVAQVTFGEEDITPAGETPAEVAQRLSALGIAVLGANCSVGSGPMLRVMEEMARHTRLPLSALPNAGLPTSVGGRLVYLSSPEYMAQYAVRLRDAGVTVLGGCCGTTPAHIAAMREALSRHKSPGPPVMSPKREPRASGQLPLPAAPQEPTHLAQKLGKQFVVTVEVDPPRGFDVSATLAQARSLLASVPVDAFNVTDSPRAQGRMSALAMSSLIQSRLGVEAILHMATRHRNLLALHSDLLGAHGLGVRNIFVVMGDPPNIGDYPQATPIADVTASGLIQIIRQANQGLDRASRPMEQPTSFFVGCAFNLGAQDLDRELGTLERKVKAGAHFILTQAVFDPETVVRCHRLLGGFPLPLILGVLPLRGARHAEFLHNEVPGIAIPEHVFQRLRAAGHRASEAGTAVAQELLQAVRPLIAGVYFIPAFGRYDGLPSLLQGLPVANLTGSAAASPR
ncbi:MAG: bifunctional homocysteine S-methyltransferase/methylenetetrahydrofolate reductase [Chloroflexi bacterium]|nr:bifunctional homocysteine S-methyltransferase/methylenetetrahydrofolate reductase [Chloroflexota bacterium]